MAVLLWSGSLVIVSIEEAFSIGSLSRRSSVQSSEMSVVISASLTFQRIVKLSKHRYSRLSGLGR